MTIQSVREFINLHIYNSKVFALTLSRLVIILVSLVTIAALIVYYGFPQTEESQKSLIMIIQGSFAFYIFNYFLKIFYSFEPLVLIRETWFEAIIMLFLIVEGISYNLFDNLILSEVFIRLGIKNITHYYAIFIQLYFLAVVVIAGLRSSHIMPIFKIHPSRIFISSFVLIILIGTGLLMLPEMTTIEGSMPFIDALFTSTSATCVTGLIVYDTPTFFTLKGQIIIMILIKLGGLNIIAFGSFLVLASKFGFGVKENSAIEDFVNKESALSAKGMLGRVVIWSFAIEFIGAALIFFSWSEKVVFKDVGEQLFYSLFHSFSAFNNAGFSLFTDGLSNEVVKENWAIHNLISILVFLGALGMMAIFDIFDLEKIKERAKMPWKQLTFATKIALYFSIGLVLFGAVSYYFLESDNTLEGMSTSGIITTSFFQSITRTSGFNTVDIGSVTLPMLVILTFLMFVGSSSSSTGGGIKTSTFALLCASTIATIRGRKTPQLFEKSISNDLVFKAYSVFLFFVIGNMISIFLLCISEQEILAMEGRSIMDLIFEEVSAFGTVGISMGITSHLSYAGKVIIILSMFVGRLGTLTVAFGLAKKPISTSYKYPDGHTMVA
ncbi:MAG TPA: ATPase [Flavobacteriales bacterium]|nr:ATPase [Flavobacteriales bacterium]